MKGGVITAIGRDGRQTVDPEPTCEAEMTGDHHPPAGPSGRHGRSGEHDRGPSDLGQPGAGLGVDPTDGVMSGLHVPHLPQAAHHLLRPGRVGLVDRPGGQLLGRVAAGDVTSGGLPANRVRASRRCTAASIAATPATTNVRIVQKYRELSTDQHTGGDGWRDRPARRCATCPRRMLNFAPHLAVCNETLGAEAFELIRAANSGCGFITTVHSLSPRRR